MQVTNDTGEFSVAVKLLGSGIFIAFVSLIFWTGASYNGIGAIEKDLTETKAMVLRLIERESRFHDRGRWNNDAGSKPR